MKISDNGIDLLIEFEGTGPIKNGKLQPYKDVAGLLTIGYGHLLTESEKSLGKLLINGNPTQYGNGITKEQAISLKKQDLVRFEKAVNEAVKVELNQNQFDALVCFAFNIGDGAFKKSTLVRKLNEGDYDSVETQLMRWNKANGKPVAGLTRRRQAEADLFNSVDNIS